MGQGQSQSLDDNSALKEYLEEQRDPEAPKTSQNAERIHGLTRLIAEESRRRKDVERDEYDRHKDNMLLLKQMYKKMDPSIMKTSTYQTHGEVELSFKYLPTKETLLVKVIRARDLNAKDLRGKTSDPYVQLSIHPTKTGDAVMQTHVAKKTLNPVYHEIFSIHLSDAELRKNRLVIQVWDKDVLNQDDLIGECLIPLSSFDFLSKQEHTAWYSLHAETDLKIKGELEISLSYKMPQTLIVRVHGGHGLTNRYEEGEPNPFVKLQIPGIQAVFKTKTKKNTVNPEWNEMFEFECPQEEFGYRYIVFHCIDWDKSGMNESLGQVIIDLETYHVGEEFSGRFKLSDLKNSDRLRARWFQHATIQEFREALISHACFRYPNMLFQKHEGSKHVTVVSKKAGTSAKLKIVDGIPVW